MMRLALLAAITGGFLALGTADAVAQDLAPATLVKQAVGRMDAWLGPNTNGNEWRVFLKSTELNALLANPAQAKAEAVAAILNQYTCGVAGLERPQFVAVQKALAAWHADLARPQPADLSALALAAKGSYVAAKPEAILAARSQLQNSIALLERFLGNGANGQAWRTYLFIEELKAQLVEGAPVNSAVLDKAAMRFGCQRAGLSLPAFANVKRTLGQYRKAVYPSIDADKFDAKLDELSQALAAFQQTPAADLADRIGQTLGWLEVRSQAPQLVAAVRHYYRHPNFFLEISEPLVGAGMQRYVNDTAPVNDVILGTRISGTGWTSGYVTADLVPYANWVAVDTLFNGRTKSRTVGRNGPARIDSAGTTTFQVRKRLYFNERGFQSPDATAAATTHTQTLGVNAGRGGILFSGIANGIAANRVAQSKPQAQAIAADHAEGRLIDRVEKDAGPDIADMNRRYQEKIRQPLFDKGQFPALFHFNTTQDYIYGTGLQANAYQLGAYAPPPALTNRADICLRLHESAVNNLAQGAYAGRTITQDEYEQELRDNNGGKFPDWYKPNPRKARWSITLDDEDPAVVTFADGGFVISLRSKELDGVVTSSTPWRITAKYKWERFGQGFAAVREGKVEVEPPAFKPGDQMGSREVATARKISDQFDESFLKPRIERDGLTLPGEWEKAGKLQLVQLNSDNGWLLQTWKKP